MRMIWSFALAIAMMASPEAGMAEHGAIIKHIPAHSKIYVDEAAGICAQVEQEIRNENLAVTLVDSPEAADYLIGGTAREHYPSYLRTVVLSGEHMYEATITLKNAKTGEMVLLYTRDKRKASTIAKDFAKELSRTIQ